MAGELVSFGIQKLSDLLSQECELFLGFEDQVSGLKRDLNLLRSFLKDANARKHTTVVVRNAVKEIEEIVYDAEDMIETYLLKEKIGKTSGIKTTIRRLACTVPDRRRHASDIGIIRRRISDVIGDMQSFGVQRAVADGGYIQPIQRAKQKAYKNDYESEFIGLEANVKKLVRYFVEEDNVQIVSITGMGGLGKTTLARQVFNHEMVKNKFDRLAWVCVSQDFTWESVWRTILQNLTTKDKKDEILKMKKAKLQDELIRLETSQEKKDEILKMEEAELHFRFLETSKEKKDEIMKMEEADLQNELFRLLETSKSLIVFDDIWEEDDWKKIKPIFPPNKAWKVLLTSRNESVVMRRDTTYIKFKPECLTIPDSWTLFQRIAMPRKDASESNVDEDMEELGKKMIVHCRGLPLAVKVLGGMLAKQYTLHDWKRLSENIVSRIMRETNVNSGNSSVYDVLSLSFEELPSYLKHCFLYLAHFPEDHKINVEDLSYYWAAEGISKHRHYDGETIRDIGDSYIEELVWRNMVISERDVTTLRFETCHLHDMMREVCLLKATEENFLQIGSTHPSSTNFQSSGTSRRFVSHNPSKLEVERDVNNPKLRSLMVVVTVNGFYREFCELSGSRFKRLELLKVLNLFKVRFKGGKLPSSIGNLIHLRYLSLKRAFVYHLPASLGNLLLLIYLNLDVSYYGFMRSTIFVPNVLMGLQELRYLALPRRMQRKTKLQLSKLVKLETLKNFSTENGSVEDLSCMVKLRTLTMELIAWTSLKNLSASISGLRHLEDLEIKDRCWYKKNLEEGIVWNFSHLKRLCLSMHMPKLPKEQHSPTHLTFLSLMNCCLKEDPMPILEKLLHLYEVELSYKSYSGKKMVCSDGGFPELQKLKLIGLEEWEEWKVEKGSMPLLHTLSISSCIWLKELPDGLRLITSLKELKIYASPLEFEEKLSRGGEDFYKVQHIPVLKISKEIIQKKISEEEKSKFYFDY